MNLVTTAINAWRTKRRLKKLKAAFATVEAAGYFVCNIQQLGGTNYLVDGKGVWHKVGRK